MPNSARESYLETQVLTATPQRLRLMLIEGALRFGRQAIECWEEQDSHGQRCAALACCNDILAELHGTIRADDLAVAQHVKAIYQFLLVQLARVSNQDDPKMLREVIEVLEIERETWRQLCEQMPEAPTRDDGTLPVGDEVTATGMKAIAPMIPTLRSESGPSIDGLSLEA